jgi:prepilin-type N-terminal cleavage/methylation domain-containing protein
VTRRRGFTLIEVVVALLILGLVVLLASGIFAGVSRAAAEVGLGRRQFDRDMNAQRWLARSLRSLEAGTPQATPFVGDSAGLSYTSWQPVPDGWLERVPVRIGVASGKLVANANGVPVTLRDSVEAVAVDYLLTPGALSPWVHEWRSAGQPPIAVRFRIALLRGGQPVDTLLFLIKERG